MLSRGVISSAKGMIPDISKVGYPMCCYRFHQMKSAIIAENDRKLNLYQAAAATFWLSRPEFCYCCHLYLEAIECLIPLVWLYFNYMKEAITRDSR